MTVKEKEIMVRKLKLIEIQNSYFGFYMAMLRCNLKECLNNLSSTSLTLFGALHSPTLWNSPRGTGVLPGILNNGRQYCEGNLFLQAWGHNSEQVLVCKLHLHLWKRLSVFKNSENFSKSIMGLKWIECIWVICFENFV